MTRATERPRYPGISACFLLLLASVAPRAASGQAAPSKEYELKAAFLLNFVQFIQWPAAAFPTPATPISIGVLGDDPFGAVLEQTFQGESVQGHKFIVRRSQRADDLKNCHLVFVSKSEKEKQDQVLANLNDGSIVTVGEMDQFVQHGGIINFYFDGNKIRFEINPDAAQRKGLKVSSQLLKRAKLVGSDSGKGR